MVTNDLFYYLKKVQLRAGLRVSSSYPSTPTDEENQALDAINRTLRYLNLKHYLTFQQTEYTLTTTAGTASYNLASAPYSQTYWRNFRIARNGLRRAEDDTPITWMDYSVRDRYRPVLSANNKAMYYSAFGENLVLFPPGDGSQIKVRYYGLHIGTDTTGVTQKIRLSVTSDLPMLDDQWEDVLVVGGAMRSRQAVNTDSKYLELKKEWEDWENILIDMGNQTGGEDAGPALILEPYCYSPDNFLQSKYYPFFTGHE